MIDNKHFIPLKPALYNGVDCPQCGAENPTATGFCIPGMECIGQYECPNCGLAFASDLPVGFAIDLPFVWRLSDGEALVPPGTTANSWRPHPARLPRSDEPHGARREVFTEHKRIVILNTLDFLYGHVVLKLFNAQYYLDEHPDVGLVVMVPRMFEWLVPDGVAEKWVFDMKLAQGRAWNTAIDRFVHEQLERYDEVYLAPGYSHPEFTGVDIERFTRVKPFALTEFLGSPPRITIVARRDRVWYPSPTAKLMHRMARRLGIMGGWGARMQDRLIARLVKAVRRELPKAHFTIVGLAPRTPVPGGVEDLRTTTMDLETELMWCRHYAKSQVVVGVHGSNMILPTAHAAGCVEILPYDRYGNIVQDIAVRYNDRMQLFMYRFTDEFATPAQVARHVVSMFKDYQVYRADNQVNIF